MFPFSRPPNYQEKTELAKVIANRGLQTPTQRPAPLVRPAGMPWLQENMDMTTLGLGVLGAGAGFAAAPVLGVAGLPLAAGLAGLGVFAPQVADYFLNPAAPAPPAAAAVFGVINCCAFVGSNPAFVAVVIDAPFIAFIED